MTHPFLSVILPTYNDALKFPVTIIDIDRYLKSQKFDYEIIVVDDGSEDSTQRIIEHFQTFIKNMKFIKNSGHRGRGTAVRLGMIAAKGNWRLVMDSHNIIGISELNRILDKLTPGSKSDILIASRGMEETHFEIPIPLRYQIIEYSLNRFSKKILKLPCSDFLLRFHCFSQEAAEHIFSNIKLSTQSYVAEALFLGTEMGYVIEEFPVSASQKNKHPIAGIEYLQMFWETLKIWWWHRHGAYQFNEQINTI